MTRAHKISNLFGAVVPFLAFIAAIVLLWNRIVDWSDLALFAVMYVLTGLGITVGYHRLLTHRSFMTYKPIEYVFATLGSMAVQGPVIAWVADHRKHHAHTDEEGDPHSRTSATATASWARCAVWSRTGCCSIARRPRRAAPASSWFAHAATSSASRCSGC